MELELKDIKLKEIISYSKRKESPKITILDKVNKTELEEIGTISNERLQLLFLCASEGNIVFVGNSDVAIAIARKLKKKAQVMYYDFAQRPSCSLVNYALTGYTKSWITLKDNGYIVKAYDEEGQEMQQPCLDTNIKEVTTSNLQKLGLKNFEISLGIRSIGSSGNSNKQILELSRYHFIHNRNLQQRKKLLLSKRYNNS